MPTFVPIPGSSRRLQPNSRPAGRPDRSEPTRVTIRVRSKGDLAELEAEAYELGATPIAQRTYLTPPELEAPYGSSPEDLDAVEAYGREHDLTATHRSALERTVTLSGKLGDVLAAFPADVGIYHSPMGTYRGRVGTVGIPSELGGCRSRTRR